MKSLLAKLVIGCVFLAAAAPGVYAERKYVVGFSNDVVTGVTNQAGQGNFGLSPLIRGYLPFYSSYPSLSLKSIGHRSTLDMNYSFTADRYQMSSPITTLGHAFRSELSSELGKRARLKLNGAFTTTPRLSTINVLTGFTLSPTGGFGYLYEPQLFDNVYQHANGGAELELDITKSSSLTFAGSGANMHYGGGASAVAFLSNQIRAEGSLAYSYRRGQRQTWGIKYSYHQNDFSRFGVFRSHSATLTHSSELRPTLHLEIEAGPSLTEGSLSLPQYLGFKASVGISKTIRANMITLNYSHRSGDSTGYGGIVEIDQIALSFSRTLGRSTTLRMDASAFNQKQHASAAYKFRSLGGSMALTREIGRRWQVGLGAGYQDYPSESGIYPTGGYPGRVYKRLYLTIGYHMPELWRFSK